MASVHYAKRKTGAGNRYYIRARLGGREARLQHLETCHTLDDARAAVRRYRTQLATTGTLEPPRDAVRAVALEAAQLAYVAARHDVGDATRTRWRGIARANAVELADLGALVTTDVDARLVARWIGELVAAGKTASTCRHRRDVLRGGLEWAGVRPDPTRDPLVRLPQDTRKEIQPPTHREFAALLAAAAPKYQLVLRFLESTGVRVGEAVGLTWGAVDASRGRLRVASKTPSGRRWVHPPADVLEDLLATRGEAGPADRVFPGLVDSSLRAEMIRACKKAGVPSFSPHDLRHRFISKLVLDGVPVTVVKERAGHSRASMTLDVYSHVILED